MDDRRTTSTSPTLQLSQTARRRRQPEPPRQPRTSWPASSGATARRPRPPAPGASCARWRPNCGTRSCATKTPWAARRTRAPTISACRRCGTTSVRPQRRLLRAIQPMGERPRDWIRRLTPTVRRDPRVTVLCERLSTLHDVGAGVERLQRTGRPTSPVLFSPRRSGGASRGGGEASIDVTKGASDERAGDPALAGSGAVTPSP